MKADVKENLELMLDNFDKKDLKNMLEEITQEEYSEEYKNKAQNYYRQHLYKNVDSNEEISNIALIGNDDELTSLFNSIIYSIHVKSYDTDKKSMRYCDDATHYLTYVLIGNNEPNLNFFATTNSYDPSLKAEEEIKTYILPFETALKEKRSLYRIGKMVTEGSKQNKKVEKTGFEKRQHVYDVVLTVAILITLIMSVTWIFTTGFSWELVVAIVGILFAGIAILDSLWNDGVRKRY